MKAVLPSSRMPTLLLLAFSVVATPAFAQQCIGLPSTGQGTAAYGFEGTDGATGESFAVSARFGRAAVLVQRSRLDLFRLQDPVSVWSAKGSWRPSGLSVPLCLTAGAAWTSYFADWRISTSFDSETGERTAVHDTDGEFDRARVPAGVSLGQAIRFAEGDAALIPFINPYIAYEYERLSPLDGTDEVRHRVGVGGAAGVALRYKRILLHSSVDHLFGEDAALSGQRNWPFLSLRAGLVF